MTHSHCKCVYISVLPSTSVLPLLSLMGFFFSYYGCSHKNCSSWWAMFNGPTPLHGKIVSSKIPVMTDFQKMNILNPSQSRKFSMSMWLVQVWRQRTDFLLLAGYVIYSPWSIKRWYLFSSWWISMLDVKIKSRTVISKLPFAYFGHPGSLHDNTIIQHILASGTL